MDCVKEPT